MKKIFGLLIALAIMFSFAYPIKTVYAESISDNLIIQLSETHTETELDIRVNLVSNTGVSAITLELDYNKNIFTFNGYEKGSALSKLDLISTDLSENPNLPIKFNWFNQQNATNDTSTGTILTIHFVLKADCPKGNYKIGFKYKVGDIVYIQNKQQKTKSAIISKAIVTISDNKIDATQIILETQKDINWILIIGITSFSVAVTAVTTTLIVLKIEKKRRKKEKWLEI